METQELPKEKSQAVDSYDFDFMGSDRPFRSALGRAARAAKACGSRDQVRLAMEQLRGKEKMILADKDGQIRPSGPMTPFSGLGECAEPDCAAHRLAWPQVRNRFRDFILKRIRDAHTGQNGCHPWWNPTWTAIAQRREVPFFADTVDPSYPWSILFLLLLIAAAWILSFWEAPKIRKKNKGGWRSDVELLLRKNSLDSPYSSPKRRPSGLQHAFWEGLYEKSERSKTFWQQAERLAASPPLQEEKPQNLVSFVHHTFPCFQRSRQAVLVLQRSGHAAHELDVEVAVEESFGGATDGKDFTAEIHIARFLKEQKEVTLPIPVVYHKGCWQNSYWFQARILNIHGEGQLAAPAQADILVLDEDTWPNNIPSSLRGGKGLSLLKYFIQADRHRRGRKWWKTMIAMVFLPVHSVLVSTLVQKILVDHVIGRIIGSDPAWGYAQCLILVLVQLLSLGLNRWADVVQTRNRGRTGGIRQVHRSEMIRKFMHLERSEYWEASEADWLYSAIYDVDVITNKAYFGVFVMVQSCFALLLSVFLVIGLAAWSYLEQDWHHVDVRHTHSVQLIQSSRKECAWFKSCIFVFTSWRHFIGLLQTEKAQLEQGLLAQNEAFVPLHWDARDTMNDTAWITHWIQGVSYCLMLTIGSFGLADSQIYGVGSFEVGTFYALCKIYLSVGKYISRLSQVFVDMQRAVVSLRDVAAMLNQTCQKSQRAEAQRFQKGQWRSPDLVPGFITFQDDLCFIRPEYHKYLGIKKTSDEHLR
eukprot:g2352.t1